MRIRFGGRSFLIAIFAVGIASVALLRMPMFRADASAAPDGERTPVVVELFTSEGCSSCPPADRVLEQLVREQPVAAAEVIGLGQHVDYWDQLGWRDRFSSSALTNRQRVYADAFRVDSIYTPQMVVDGRTEFVGSNAGAARQAIVQAAAAPHGRIDLSIESSSADAVNAIIAISGLPAPGKGDHDEAIVAVTENNLKSDVRRGENRGRTLTHAAVVRSLTAVGQVASGAGAASFTVPKIALGPDWDRSRLTVVAFVQESRSRRIVAAAAKPIPVPR